MAPLGVLSLLWLFGWWFLWEMPRLSRRTEGGQRAIAAPLSIIIPARDEAHNLGELLPAVLEQAGPGDEILVVDDHSQDGTGALAARLGARVVTLEGDPPAGWTGKNWACQQGVAAAHGAWLLFLDADTRLQPGALARLRAAAAPGRVVTVQPYHAVPLPHEQLSLFFNLIAAGGSGAFTPLRRRRPPMGVFGPCILCARADYLAAGGHAAVRGAVLEDIALGQRLLAAGCAIAAYSGQGAVHYRMYPHGAGPLIEGWTKNFSAGAAATPLARRAVLAGWLAGAVGAAVRLAAALAQPRRRCLAGPAALYALYAAQIAWLMRRLGSFHGWAALLFPVPLLAFLAVFARSAWRTYRVGTVEWKGRSISTRPTHLP